MIHRNMIQRTLRPLGVLLVVLLAGCAPLGGAAEPYATLVIDNDSAMNVNIHAVRHGSRLRIGMVPGVSTRDFPIRADMLGPGGQLDLVIDPIGSRTTYSAMPINVNRGDTIQLRVGAVIR
jgi:hypothetical protein